MNPLEMTMNSMDNFYAGFAERVAGSGANPEDILEEYSLERIHPENEDAEYRFEAEAQLDPGYSGLENYDKLDVEVQADLFPLFHEMFRHLTTSQPHLGGMEEVDTYEFAVTDQYDNQLIHEITQEEVDQLYDRANQGADVENRGRVDGELDGEQLMNEEMGMEERFAQEYFREYTEDVEFH